MTRILLIHWHEEEAAARANALARAGYEVICRSDQQANPRTLLKELPDVFLIDLARVPSHGREIGGWLRRRKEARHIPLVFVEGDSGKTQRVRELLPDAMFTTWETIDDAIREALAAPPGDPVVPGTMDAYTGVPLAKKLGVAARAVVALIDAPDGLPEILGQLPDGARITSETQAPADV
ncbi:hypothetical protein ACFLR0_02405, partial [Candidatus Bipolaricaulota bacterium]